MEQDFSNPVTPYSPKKSRFRLVIVIAVILVGLAVMIYAYNYFASARITVVTEEGAVISVATSRDSGFIPLGEGRATFVTKGSGLVFIQAEKAGRVTQQVYSIAPREKSSLSINLRQLADTEMIGDQALSSIHLEKDLLYGVDPSTKSISATSLTNPINTISNRYLSVPFVDEVFWANSNNFIFSSFRYGVGVFSNGEITNRLSYAPKGQVFGGFTKHGSNPLVLIGNDGIYASSNFGKTTTKVVDSPPLGAITLGSDNGRFYYMSSLEPSPETNTDAYQNRLDVYSYTGELLNSYSIDENIGLPINIMSTEDQQSLLVLTDNRLVSIDGGSGEYKYLDYYFESADDLLEINNLPLLLSSSGLWSLDLQTQTYYLVADMPAGTEYVPNSLTQVEDNLVFSAKATSAGLRSRSGVANQIIKVTNIAN